MPARSVVDALVRVGPVSPKPLIDTYQARVALAQLFSPMPIAQSSGPAVLHDTSRLRTGAPARGGAALLQVEHDRRLLAVHGRERRREPATAMWRRMSPAGARLDHVGALVGEHAGRERPAITWLKSMIRNPARAPGTAASSRAGFYLGAHGGATEPRGVQNPRVIDLITPTTRARDRARDARGAPLGRAIRISCASSRRNSTPISSTRWADISAAVPAVRRRRPVRFQLECARTARRRRRVLHGDSNFAARSIGSWWR